MRQRIVGILTAVALIVGTAAAAAVGNSSAPSQGGAASGQYCPPKSPNAGHPPPCGKKK